MYTVWVKRSPTGKSSPTQLVDVTKQKTCSVLSTQVPEYEYRLAPSGFNPDFALLVANRDRLFLIYKPRHTVLPHFVGLFMLVNQ